MFATSTIGTPTASEVKTLDATRQRLQQLTGSLGALLHTLQSGGPLPSWEHLQTTTDACAHQLGTLSAHLSHPSVAAFLDRAHAYPTPAFPDKRHEQTVQMLLRTKLEPGVEAWIDEGLKRGRETDGRARAPLSDFAGQGDEEGKSGQAGGSTGLDTNALRGLWDEAAYIAVSASSRTPFGIDYSISERDAMRRGETVIHGLRRQLDGGPVSESGEDDEDDDDEDEDEEMDARKQKESTVVVPKVPARKPAPLEDLLRFMNNGTISPALAAAGAP